MGYVIVGLILLVVLVVASTAFVRASRQGEHATPFSGTDGTPLGDTDQHADPIRS